MPEYTILSGKPELAHLTHHCPAHPNPNCPKREAAGKCAYCGFDFEQEHLDKESLRQAVAAAGAKAEQKGLEAGRRSLDEINNFSGDETSQLAMAGGGKVEMPRLEVMGAEDVGKIEMPVVAPMVANSPSTAALREVVSPRRAGFQLLMELSRGNLGIGLALFILLVPVVAAIALNFLMNGGSGFGLAAWIGESLTFAVLFSVLAIAFVRGSWMLAFKPLSGNKGARFARLSCYIMFTLVAGVLAFTHGKLATAAIWWNFNSEAYFQSLNK